MKKARIGVIGVGWWGTVGHLEHLVEDPKAEVVAVWSRTEEKAVARAARYGVPQAYTDYREMVDTCDLDGVVIASTPNMHNEQARYALEHGMHVLMEKPFVLQAEHARSLHQLARQNGLGVPVLSLGRRLLIPRAAALRQLNGGAQMAEGRRACASCYHYRPDTLCACREREDMRDGCADWHPKDED